MTLLMYYTTKVPRFFISKRSNRITASSVPSVGFARRHPGRLSCSDLEFWGVDVYIYIHIYTHTYIYIYVDICICISG